MTTPANQTLKIFQWEQKSDDTHCDVETIYPNKDTHSANTSVFNKLFFMSYDIIHKGNKLIF